MEADVRRSVDVSWVDATLTFPSKSAIKTETAKLAKNVALFAQRVRLHTVALYLFT